MRQRPGHYAAAPGAASSGSAAGRPLGFEELKRLGFSLKRAGFFITAGGRMAEGFALDADAARASMVQATRATGAGRKGKRGQCEGQLSLFDGQGQGAVDPWAAKRGGDVLLQAARGQRLQAACAAPQLGLTPSGLPAADPLLAAPGAAA